MFQILSADPLLFLVLSTALVFSLSFHELAHAFVAYKLGDPTAKMQGRLTLNPLAHLDPWGTFLLLFAGFGWAKPVPVNFENLNKPKRDMTLVSLAGPLANLFLATISAFVLKSIQGFTQDFLQNSSGSTLPNGFLSAFLVNFLFFLAFYNVSLCIFNLLPFHPLDGFKVVLGILPRDLALQWSKSAPYGIFVLLFLSFSNSLTKILTPILSFVLGLLGIS